MASAGVMIMTSAADTRSHAVSPLFTPVSSLLKVMGPGHVRAKAMPWAKMPERKKIPAEDRR
jgi:hypothetical protein